MKKKNRRKIGLKNFKVFKDSQTFEIAPITILTGTNSSGKSSFVKAVRLLKENFNSSKEDYDRFVLLNFQLSKIHLGGFDKVINSTTKNKNKLSKEILFSTVFKNEIWGELEVHFVYANNTNKGFESGRLLSIYIYSIQFKKEILRIQNSEIKYEKTPKDFVKTNFWHPIFDMESWYKQFKSVAEKHLFQQNVLKLREYLWNLARDNENDFLERMDENHKVFYNELLSKGISPINLNFIQEIYESDGYFMEEWQKDNFAFNISDGMPLEWNYSAEYFNNRLTTDNCILSFPLFNRPEWKINFNENGDFISKPSGEIDIKAYTDFNSEMYFKISQALIDKKIFTKSDAEKYIMKKELSIIEKYYLSKLNIDSFSIFHSSSEFGFGRIREVKNNLSDILKVIFNFKPPVYEMPHDPKEIDDFVYFDNVFFEKNSSGVKSYFFDVGKDRNNMFAQWKSFQDSFKFIIDSINNVIKEAFKSFADLSDFIFVDTQRDLNQRIFLDKDDTDFNNSMREYVRLESLETNQSEAVKFITRDAFIKNWIRKFEISDDFLVERDREGIGTRTYLVKNTEKELLVDVGFGVNKLFSLILKVAISPKDSTIFIEEPESNLHPAMQSKLADLLVDAHQTFGHFFVLETHSEYLIRKLQFLVASENSPAKAEDINIYYLFHPDRVPEGRKQVEKLEIRLDGGLSAEFGPGFIDEAINWKFELMRMKQAQKN